MLQVLGPRAIVVDAMCGVGGNAIQFAQYFKVIAIDLSEERLKIAHHNATIYGVAHNIDFIHGNFLTIAPELEANAVFLSPPWGGPSYAHSEFDLNSIGGFEFFESALTISPNIAYYLPRNVNEGQLHVLASMSGGAVEKETCYLNSRLKAVTGPLSFTLSSWFDLYSHVIVFAAYFGLLAGADHVEMEELVEENLLLEPGDPLPADAVPSKKRSRKERRLNRHKIV